MKICTVVSTALLTWVCVGCGPVDLPDDMPAPGTKPAPLQKNDTVPDGLHAGRRFIQDTLTIGVPEGQSPPQDVTFTGKATGKLRQAVEAAWGSVPLVDPAGKAIVRTIRLDTEQGTIRCEIDPSMAPIHATNLFTLVKIGFYDGLRFDRIIHRDERKLVRFGCPQGSGDAGAGHLGYFLRPEIATNVKHEKGTIGFWRDEDRNSAGTRLYICLDRAEALDGQFTVIGRVCEGLNVVETIATAAVVHPDRMPDRETPRRPIVIRSAKIENP
jgi:peptidyl-prolyl cis-trans isomerase B (cyclophilin B)